MNQLLQSLFISLLAVTPVLSLSASRTIRKVEAVSVQCPVGTSPRLPNRLWVTYRDGRAEYRQVRWMNAPLTSEEDEADARRHPAGLSYRLKGYVVGDNTTDNGYPVEAIVRVVGEPQPVPVREKAVTFPLSAVTINGDNRLSHNRDEAIKKICSLDVTQQALQLPRHLQPAHDGLHHFRRMGLARHQGSRAMAPAITCRPSPRLMP